MNLDSKGLVATFSFHGLLLLMLFFAYFSTPLPLPAEQGLLINFGDVKYASGPEESRAVEKPQPQQESSTKAQQEVTPKAEERIMTQDNEEAPAIKTSEKKKKNEPEKRKETPAPVKTESQTKTKEEPKEEKPVVNTKSLYTGKKQNSTYSGSEGVTQGSGNQGDPNGSENSTDRSLGFGSGGGVSANLNGRSPVALPEPDFDHQKEGKVVVEVKVDRSGKVVDATPGVKGSTTLDSYLLSVAKKAALSSRFDNNPDAPFYQVGTITYIFKLK